MVPFEIFPDLERDAVKRYRYSLGLLVAGAAFRHIDRGNGLHGLRHVCRKLQGQPCYLVFTLFGSGRHVILLDHLASLGIGFVSGVWEKKFAVGYAVYAQAA